MTNIDNASKSLQPRVSSITSDVESLVIKTPVSYSRADDFLIMVKDHKTQVNEAFDPIIQKAHESHVEALKQKKKFWEPLDNAEKTLKIKMKVYQDEQTQLHEAELSRLKREAEKEQEERMLAKAIKLEEQGMTPETVTAMLNFKQPVVVDTSAVPEVPQFDKRVFKKSWKFKIINPNLIPRQYLCPDLTKIGQYVRTMKVDAKIEGVEIWEE